MNEPWHTDRWSVSPHNFADGVAPPAHPVELHDITLRDSEECADVAFSVDDKVRIAEALALAGFKHSELFGDPIVVTVESTRIRIGLSAIGERQGSS